MVNSMSRYEEILCDANVLHKAYMASIKGSKWKDSTQRFMLNYLRYIFQIKDDIYNRTLQNGPTNEFDLLERGRARPVTSYGVRDRIIRHALCDDILLPEIQKQIIYDNGASIKGRGISFSRKRFEVHLHKYYRLYGNEGWIVFGDFTKFYDNIIHETAKQELLKLFGNDEFLDWLLTMIFKGFEVDVSYMSDEEYANCLDDVFNKLEYRKHHRGELTREKFMAKSVDIGDQLSQIIGIYYPYRIDNYVKYVRGQKFYGRYMDDWYIMGPSKEELADIVKGIHTIAASYGIHINEKKTRFVKISGPYKYLQIKYSLLPDGTIVKRINQKRVTEMRRKLKKLAGKWRNGEMQYENIENMFKGWMGSFYKLMSKKQRYNMIELYEDLFDKDISIAHKKIFIGDRR